MLTSSSRAECVAVDGEMSLFAAMEEKRSCSFRRDHVRPALSAVLYSTGSTFFIVGSVLINHEYTLAIALYILGSTCFLTASIMDLFANFRRIPTEPTVVDMIHEHEHLAREEELLMPAPVRTPGLKVDWANLILPVLYIAGATGFFLGSLLFIPSLATQSWVPTLGTWIFRMGSCTYLTCSAICYYGFWKSTRGKKTAEEEEVLLPPSGAAAMFYLKVSTIVVYSVAQLFYVCGACLFIVGGIVFELDKAEFGALAWTLGSGCFLLGSLVNLLEAFRKPVMGR